jgi:hypothetical protein
MPFSLNTKPKLIAFFAVLIAANIFGIYEFVRLARETHVHGILKDIGVAFEQSEKLPLGHARAEDVIRRLRAINTAYAPADMKQALQDYTNAFKRLLDATESGRDTAPDSNAMSEARAKMLAIDKHYEGI